MTNNITTIKHRWISYINSLFLFLLAFIIIYWINILTTIVTSYIWGVETIIRNFRVEFLIGPQSKKWNIDSIIFIFLSAPFVSLILAGIISRIRLVYRGENGYVNLFLIWGYFYAIIFSIGAFISGVISKQMIWYALAWIGIPVILQYVLAIALLIVLFFVGYATCLFFLESCVYPSPSNSVNRQSWFLNAALKPWLTGSLLLTLAFYPEINGFEVYLLALMIVLIIPLFKRSKLIPTVYVYEEIENPVVLWKAGLIAFGLIILLKFYPFIF